ncbi:hypothetical protein BS17DRAFT_781042 [Gyrodon lividus]|nr:hypothetical protein BS17DRAFT_781042 [Gyrodon lividus]
MAFPLPDELTELTFNNLDVVSLLTCTQVCKLFHSIILGSTQLVYKIELFASHMEDGNHSSLDTVGRLKALRQYTRAWNNLEWTQHATVLMREGHCWELSGGILAQSTPQNEISCVQLPCKAKGIPEKRWTVPFDFRIRDLTFDNSQDLFALLELVGTFPTLLCNIHLRTLTGEPHPRAALPLITHAPQSMHDEFSFLAQICGPHIAILFFDPVGAGIPNSFIVWNWHTGDQKVYILMPQFRSFSFMTEDLILAAIIRSDDEPCLDVLSITGCSDPIQDVKDMPYVCELRYPAFKGHVEHILIRSEPTPSWRPPASLMVPFYASRKNFIFTITLRLITDNDAQENTVLLVPLSTLLSQVSLSRDTPQRRVIWKEWGPQGSRMICRESSETWVCYTYGMRFIQGLRWKNGHEARVYDFNPYAARKYVKTSNDSSIPWKPLVREATMKSQCFGFVEEVMTTLPGRVASFNLAHSKDGWEAAMIGEDNIVMVQPDAAIYGYMAM